MNKNTGQPIWALYPFRPDARPCFVDREPRERPKDRIDTAVISNPTASPAIPGEIIYRAGSGRSIFYQRYWPTPGDVQSLYTFHRSDDPRLPDWIGIRSKLLAGNMAADAIDRLSVVELLALIHAGEFGKQPVQNAIAVAVVMKTNNPRLSVRAAARAVGVSYSALQRSELWRLASSRLRLGDKKDVRRGQKDKNTGNVDGEDDNDDS